MYCLFFLFATRIGETLTAGNFVTRTKKVQAISVALEFFFFEKGKETDQFSGGIGASGRWCVDKSLWLRKGRLTLISPTHFWAV